jgi:hypothetical protein
MQAKRRLKYDTPLTFERDFDIPADAEDGSRATLTGTLQIRTYRRGDPGTGTTTDQLKLIQRKPGKWYVVESEVERTMKAAALVAKLNAPSPAEYASQISRSFRLIAYGSLAGVVVGISFFLFGRKSANRA